MPSRYTHDVVATVGKYTKDGEEKKKYANVGKAFTDEQGRISIKMETVPIGPDWSGWLSLYPAKDRDERPQAPARNHQSDAGDSDDIPF